MFAVFSTADAWIALITLAALEIVLGIDNIVFITILAGKLPKDQQLKARRLGLAVALLSRLALLATLSWVVKLTTPLFSVLGHEVSGRDLILLLGGLFLMAKATFEIYDKVEAAHPTEEVARQAKVVSMASILFQIMLLDLVFSLDSVITAVGMVDHLSIMVVAVIIAVAVMLIFAGPVGDFVDRHPSIKILALSFLVMIGVLLVAEGTGKHLPKGYVYFGMAFSLLIELLNMRYRKNVQKGQAAGH
ncbi:MAG TPA: TerC family protein [Thermoanaerobaculia bacterium]|nr:TerC family protein [Thermoanaerobaculia bacterium]